MGVIGLINVALMLVMIGFMVIFITGFYSEYQYLDQHKDQVCCNTTTESHMSIVPIGKIMMPMTRHSTVCTEWKNKTVGCG